MALFSPKNSKLLRVPTFKQLFHIRLWRISSARPEILPYGQILGAVGLANAAIDALHRFFVGVSMPYSAGAKGILVHGDALSAPMCRAHRSPPGSYPAVAAGVQGMT
jgi:hypothetical protein